MVQAQNDLKEQMNGQLQNNNGNADVKNESPNIDEITQKVFESIMNSREELPNQFWRK